MRQEGFCSSLWLIYVYNPRYRNIVIAFVQTPNVGLQVAVGRRRQLVATWLQLQLFREGSRSWVIMEPRETTVHSCLAVGACPDVEEATRGDSLDVQQGAVDGRPAAPPSRRYQWRAQRLLVLMSLTAWPCAAFSPRWMPAGPSLLAQQPPTRSCLKSSPSVLKCGRLLAVTEGDWDGVNTDTHEHDE